MIKRIGILAPPWPIPAPAYGGLEAALDGLCRGLTAAGIEVFLWSHEDSTCPVHRGAITITDPQENGWHSAPTEVRHVLEGYDWLNSHGVELVHDHTFVGPLIGTRLTAVPVVTTNWLPFNKPEPGQTHPDLERIYRGIAEQVPVLALSSGQASRAPELVTQVIHLGTEVDGVTVGDGRGDQDGEYLAFLGRMAPEKGIDRAIAAARENGVRLKIAARMDEAQELAYYHDEVERHVDGKNVVYLGEVDHSERAELLRGATALLNPMTWEEPFGLVMVEALAVGTPVIAGRGGSVSEIITPGITGAICENDAEVVAAVRERSSYSRQECRRRADEHFSYQVMTRNHLAFYEGLLEGRAR